MFRAWPANCIIRATYRRGAYRNRLIGASKYERKVSRITGIFSKIKSETVKPFSIVWTSHMLIEVFLLMHPALVPVFMKEFGLSVFEAGMIITVPSVCRLFFVLPTGILADKFGPRSLVILSMLVAGFAGILVSQSMTVSFLVVSLSLIMISVTLYHPPGLSILGRLFGNPKERNMAIGFHGTSGCIGQSLGTISLGLLLLQYGWRSCYLLFSVPLLAWTVILAKTKILKLSGKPDENSRSSERSTEDRCEPRNIPRSFKTQGFLILLATMGLNALANGSVGTFMTTYMTTQEHLTVETASIIFGAGPLMGIIGSLLGGYLSSKLGERNALSLTYIGQVVFLLGLITIASIPLAMLSFLIFQMFSASMWTPASSIVASLTDRSIGGRAYSLYFLSSDAFGATSPLIAAALITVFSIYTPFFFAIILLASNALLARLIPSTHAQ